MHILYLQILKAPKTQQFSIFIGLRAFKRQPSQGVYNLKTIYLIRHAESIGQHPDGSLTELGKKQAQDMAASRLMTPKAAPCAPSKKSRKAIINVRLLPPTAILLPRCWAP